MYRKCHVHDNLKVFQCIWPEAVEKYRNFYRVRRSKLLQRVEKLPSFYGISTVHYHVTRGRNGIPVLQM